MTCASPFFIRHSINSAQQLSDARIRVAARLPNNYNDLTVAMMDNACNQTGMPHATAATSFRWRFFLFDYYYRGIKKCLFGRPPQVE